MSRTLRIAIAAAALALMVVASALAAPSERGQQQMAPVAASHQPQSPGGGDDPTAETQEDEDGAPSQELLDRLVAKLGDAGITADSATIAALAADYGVGGAVRLLSWAQASGRPTAEIAGMFDSGLGWGEIARELNEADDSLDLGPGIGRIMGNGGPPDGAQALGLGRANAPGQQKRQ